jgi:hypothetical protein
MARLGGPPLPPAIASVASQPLPQPRRIVRAVAACRVAASGNDVAAVAVVIVATIGHCAGTENGGTAGVTASHVLRV